MKILLKISAFLLCALLLAAFLVLPATEAAYSGVYDKTLRFHVLANSDDPADQQLKFHVRDGLVDYLSPFLESCPDRAAAESLLSSMLDQIEVKAREILLSEGSDLPVSVVLGKEYYPTRSYENLSYPAGVYQSLRVYLGKGEGQNWWCVAFPPLCLSPSSTASSLARAGYTDDEQSLVTQKDEGYTVRFFILDLAARIKELFS